MNFKRQLKVHFDQFLTFFKLGILITALVSSFLTLPTKVFAQNESKGEHLFIKNCSGCHIKGGNIIRRNKTLKLKDLHRNGLDTTEEIAKIAREGIGSMSGYKEVLGENGDEIVANWILLQAQKAWIQG
ncbi:MULTISPECIES: c-type cytochrome [unclassified Prochlorococcus]|uniref:c-type cytochrome n=1 Tax=unclassified Prochlorococcus TaxID=2627481 RepID=UPI0005337C22|nr:MULTISPECIES: c-type cytochrome [unclassified Prochlorococcus]KGG17144.1 Cytochrome C553 (soluble cytochrome f) [Prochlorococcus sp. MIT 0603]